MKKKEKNNKNKDLTEEKEEKEEIKRILPQRSWRRKRRYGVNIRYSISKELRKEGKSSDQFEVMLGNIALEELIALKLELSIPTEFGILYDLPIWRYLPEIVKTAVLRWAATIGLTKTEAGRILGMNRFNAHRLIKHFQADQYFLIQKKKLPEKIKYSR